MSINNIDNEHIIDAEYEEVENVLYLSAPQLAKKIGTTEASIRTWAEIYGDLIGTEKINGRKTYKETQVSSYAFIKELVDNKNMKRTQVRNYISKHGFKYAEYNSGLVNPKDPLGFEALASALSVEVSSKLDIFAKELMTNVSNQLVEHLIKQQQMNIETKAEIEACVDEIVSENLDLKFDQLTNDLNIKLETQLQQSKEHDIQMVETLKQHMEERHLQQIAEDQLKQQEKKKGIIARLLGK